MPTDEPRTRRPGWVGERLSAAPPAAFAAYAIAAAFGTYFCMYAFRKPFAAAEYAHLPTLPWLPALEPKVVLVIAQGLGYALSKFVGIKVVSELEPARRALGIVLTIGVAEAALVLFAVTPQPWGALWLFLNGLPLGLVWGLVFGFLEGRRVSDGLGAGLAASFIVASGFVKSAGRLVLAWGVPELWMPAVTGLLFLPALLGFVWLLAQLPPPSPEDVSARSSRTTMDGAARREFFAALWPGLSALTLAYVLLTAYRDFRDNFASELWTALGWEDATTVLTTAELPVAAGALLAVALVSLVRDNRRALLVIHGLLLAGSLLVGGSTVLFQLGLLGPAPWMILVGLGLYVGYVPYNCVLFDRLIPAMGLVGTAGFMIYVTDAFGYLGTTFLLLYKNFASPELSWLEFFQVFSLASAGGTALLYLLSASYFARRARRRSVEPAAT